MYVCICRAIRDREVEAAVRAGARRPADIFRSCGTNAQCGSCAGDMREHIERVSREAAAAPSLMAAD